MTIARHKVDNSVTNKCEQFALTHYIKAINHLQNPLPFGKDRPSFRVILIVCIIFVSLELLRGHFSIAQLHLRQGLHLLRAATWLTEDRSDMLVLRRCHESLDNWITEAFSRLHIQVELSKQHSQHECLLIRFAELGPPVIRFPSAKEAWHALQRLLTLVIRLSRQARKYEIENTNGLACDVLNLVREQERLSEELVQWREIYRVSEKVLKGRGLEREEKLCKILQIYHTMTSIMVNTCLKPGDESAFDLHSHQFSQLIQTLADLWWFSSTTDEFVVPPGYLADMTRSVVDMGCIFPLYYVAIKCRVHRIRIQAVRILESTYHREGIWDAKITACISRKVIQLEEKDYLDGQNLNDDFSLFSYPKNEDLLTATPPTSYRLQDIELIFRGDPTSDISILCTKFQGGIRSRVCVGTFHLPEKLWVGRATG
jgi:hypothetical protein